MLPDYQYENKITSFSISPGDFMYVHIEYDSTNNCANFLVQDLTTNNYSSFCALHANNDYRSGPTAEWIVERPTVSGSYTKLANFGSETFTNA
jgi:hypothetical protein